jgi:exopolysaccharide production repressor protein
MYFPQFLVGMPTTSGIVGAWAYVAPGSMWKAGAWGIITAVLLQVGYFTLLFKLVYGRRNTEQVAVENTPDATKRPVSPRQPEAIESVNQPRPNVFSNKYLRH